jgi:hypothetical protein
MLFFFNFLKFIFFLKKLNKVKINKNNKESILIDYFDDYLTIYSYSLIFDYLRNRYNSKIEWFNFLPWFNNEKYFKHNSFKKIIFLLKFFIGRINILNKCYDAIGVNHGISYKNFSYHKLIALRKAKKVFSELRSKEDVFQIKIKGFKIGSYIYQTYLRYYSLPTVNVRDLKLLDEIFKSFLIYLSIEEYFKENKVKLVIVSHAFYSYYGIIAKYAASKGVQVIRIASAGWRNKTSFIISKINKNHIEEAPPYYMYKKIFNQFSNKEKKEKLLIGNQILKKRYQGEIQPFLLGNISSYADNKKNIILKKNKKNILVFLNCFFDGPGRFKSAIFPDFYEWIIFTLDNAANTNFDWYVKPHPRSQPGNDDIINSLKNKYKIKNNIYFIDKSISNKKLIDSNFKSLFMHHGNATAEFANKNFPVVNCCTSAMSNYKFFIKVKSKKAYLNIINTADNLKIKIKKREIYEWTYMNFNHFNKYDKNKKITINNFQDKISHFHKIDSNNMRNDKVLNILIDTYSEKYKHNAIDVLKKNLTK